MKATVLFLTLIFIVACGNAVDSEKQSVETKYGIKFQSEIQNRKLIVNTFYEDENDYVKSGVFSQTLLNDYENFDKAVFYFHAKNVEDSIVYNKKAIDSIKQLYKNNSCVLETSAHLLSLSNEKIIFYDSILYNIMLYDEQLHKMDTVFYAINDVSIISILLGKCLYNEDYVPEKFDKQSRYFQVLPIWCEDKNLHPLFDEKDLKPEFD